MADTVQRPGGDAGVVRVHGTEKALAISCDVTPRYCAADPYQGAKQAVAECWRNLTATGADPLAITDCMNFGNPERPEIMGEFVGAVKGMAEACTALSFPVVSGNVSLYNETNGIAIPPTPAIGGIGLIPDVAKMATLALKQDGDVLILIGPEGHHLGQSLYQELAAGRYEGAPPPRRSRGRAPRRRFRPRIDPLWPASPPCTIFPTADCWLRSPRWRLPAAAASSSTRHLRGYRPMPSGSGRIRGAMSRQLALKRLHASCMRRRKQAFPPGVSERRREMP